mmetsp:Transcript_56311/g.129158  ORF Transcript_56311/g.129158 Transcript_56311/m.129158 type:complete len:374 (+) Transcript_56311:438-1559(+)
MGYKLFLRHPQRDRRRHRTPTISGVPAHSKQGKRRQLGRLADPTPVSAVHRLMLPHSQWHLGLSGLRDGPARGHKLVRDNLPVARPDQPNRLCSPDPSSAGVTRRSEPVVLRCTRGARPNSGVTGTVHSVGEYLPSELHIVGHHSSREVVLHSLADLKDEVKLAVLVCGHHLKRAEHFINHNVKVWQELVQGHVDSRGLPMTVLLRDLRALERLTAANQAGTRDLQDLVQESEELLVAPGDHWANRQIPNISSLSQLHDLRLEPGLCPILMHEQCGLGGALLPAVGVRVLITGEGNVVEALSGGGNVGAQDLPVKPGVLNANFASQIQSQLLGHLAATSKLRHTRLRPHQEIVGNCATRIEEINVSLREPAVV